MGDFDSFGDDTLDGDSSPSNWSTIQPQQQTTETSTAQRAKRRLEEIQRELKEIEALQLEEFEEELVVQNTPTQAIRAKTLALQSAFLRVYSECGVITQAATTVGMQKVKHYEWMKDDKYPDYPARFHEAKQTAADRLETELYKRAVEGYEEPVFGRLAGKDQGDGKIGTILRKSDKLLEIALRAARPEKFNQRVEHTGAGGGPIESTLSIFEIPNNGRSAEVIEGEVDQKQLKDSNE